jgi:transposase
VKLPGRKNKLDLLKPYRSEKLDESFYTAARLYLEIKEIDLEGGKTIFRLY